MLKKGERSEEAANRSVVLRDTMGIGCLPAKVGGDGQAAFSSTEHEHNSPHLVERDGDQR